MSHNILVKLGPVLNAERWDDPKWMRPGRTFYWPGSLRLIPRQTTPIIIDHDLERVVGSITEVLTVDMTDGPWVCVRGVVDDPLPGWLRQYRTKASVGYWDVHSSPHANGSTRITSAIVQEVSLLRDLTPAEPLAEVLLIRARNEPKPALTPAVPFVDPARDDAEERARARGALIRWNTGRITAVR